MEHTATSFILFPKVGEMSKKEARRKGDIRPGSEQSPARAPFPSGPREVIWRTKAEGGGAWCCLEGTRPKVLMVQSLVQGVPKASSQGSLTSVPLVRGQWLALRKNSGASGTHVTFTMCQAPCRCDDPNITWLGYTPQSPSSLLLIGPMETEW